MATSYTRRRGGRLGQLLGEDMEWGEQAADLDGQLVRPSGNDAATLAESERTLALMEEDAVAELVVNQLALNAEMDLIELTLGSFFWEITMSVAVVFALFAAAEVLWKIVAKPQTMDIFEPTRTYDVSAAASSAAVTLSGCPTYALPCIGDRCQGSPDGVCSSPDFPNFPDCPCAVSGSGVGDDAFWLENFGDVEDMIWSYQIPAPNVPVCVDDAPDGFVSLANATWNT